MFNVAKFLPIASQIGNYIKAAGDHYSTLKFAAGADGVDLVTAFLEEKMQDWNPVVDGKKLIDPETRKAGARFLAGVAINYVGD
jgi:hypothetical protein